ncbi:hypothetical protein [Isoptericola croceus]|uniref:hypothetical protein n=1 Tax=Isoptericola croceus TaxID=3031406 RepID=UPI0023F6F588|nr:hypothetical protein [Isoptericola croceus]
MTAVSSQGPRPGAERAAIVVPEWERWEVRTFYLRRMVYDLEDLVARPAAYGIDLVTQEEEARDYFLSLPADERIWAEGYLELSIGGTRLFGPREWDYVDQIWHILVQVGLDLIDEGSADHVFPDQSMPICARVPEGDPKQVLFTVVDTTVRLERKLFLFQLAESALWFYEWHRRVTGDPMTTYREDAERVRAAALAW